jgi:hypothetical protein
LLVNAYLAYLIRLWRVEAEAGPVWRAALEDPYSADQHSFADLGGLVAFLIERTGAAIETPDSPVPGSDERQACVDLPALLAFLETQTNQDSQAKASTID